MAIAIVGNFALVNSTDTGLSTRVFPENTFIIEQNSSTTKVKLGDGENQYSSLSYIEDLQDAPVVGQWIDFINSTREARLVTLPELNIQYNISGSGGGTGGAVSSVNGKTGTVVLNAADVGAQPTLVSGTNIKTINGASLLGSGNISADELFIATYGTTTFAEIRTAVQTGKTVMCRRAASGGRTVVYSLTALEAYKAVFGGVYNTDAVICEVSESDEWSNGIRPIGGSGDTETFPVTLTQQTGGTWTADKTFAECMAAHTGGKSVIFRVSISVNGIPVQAELPASTYVPDYSIYAEKILSNIQGFPATVISVAYAPDGLLVSVGSPAFAEKGSSAGFHNSIYRGKNLGSSITAAQLAAIADGSFEDLYVGDYWVINGRTHTIADFDYYYEIADADTRFNQHHIAVLSDGNWTSVWNDTESTDAGYVGSAVRTYIENAETGPLHDIVTDFGDAHVLTHPLMLATAYASGKASAFSTVQTRAELLSETQVYGAPAAANINNTFFETGYTKRQLALFRFSTAACNIYKSQWLRNVRSATTACRIHTRGYANYGNVTDSNTVRTLSMIG